MLTIDGSEGGGQILRTALGLSALTGKACTVKNIRLSRSNPGLQEQHLQGVLAMQKLCDAELKGAVKHSTEITFIPHTIKDGKLDVSISTAGSIGLVLQILLLAATHANLTITIKGGATYGKFAPPVDHFTNVFLPLLKRMGYDVSVRVIRHGFYPKGGAHVEVKTKKAALKPLHILDKGKFVAIHGVSIASKDLEKVDVAGRQAKEAKQLLFKHFPVPMTISPSYVDTLNAGSGLQLTLETEHSLFGGDALGEKGKSAEMVAQEAVTSLLHSYEHGTVDIHTADMLLPYIALCGGSYVAPEITPHVRTNIAVIEQFLGNRFTINGTTITAKGI